MKLTRRDMDIIEFLEDFQIASASTLQLLFFPSISTCQKRMKTLSDNGKVKRFRFTMNGDYIYYLKKPSQYMHRLLITEFYYNLMKNTEVIQFQIQKKLGNMIPDSLFLCKFHEKDVLGFLEVEISNNGFNYDKYIDFYRSGVYKEWFPIMPTVYVVCKNVKLPKDSPVKFVKIKTDMRDFRV